MLHAICMTGLERKAAHLHGRGAWFLPTLPEAPDAAAANLALRERLFSSVGMAIRSGAAP